MSFWRRPMEALKHQVAGSSRTSHVLIVALVAGGVTMLALGFLALMAVLCCCKKSKSSLSYPRPNAFAKLGHLRGQRGTYALTPYDGSDADEPDEVEEDYPRPRRAFGGGRAPRSGQTASKGSKSKGSGKNGLLALPAPAAAPPTAGAPLGDVWFEQLVGECQASGAFAQGTVARV